MFGRRRRLPDSRGNGAGFRRTGATDGSLGFSSGRKVSPDDLRATTGAGSFAAVFPALGAMAGSGSTSAKPSCFSFVPNNDGKNPFFFSGCASTVAVTGSGTAVDASIVTSFGFGWNTDENQPFWFGAGATATGWEIPVVSGAAGSAGLVFATGAVGVSWGCTQSFAPGAIACGTYTAFCGAAHDATANTDNGTIKRKLMTRNIMPNTASIAADKTNPLRIR